jgi:hypothetical protein
MKTKKSKHILAIFSLLLLLANSFTARPVFALASPDLNSDGCVDDSDMAVMQTNFGSVDATETEGDLDGDKNIDVRDTAILTHGWNTTCQKPVTCLGLQDVLNTTKDATPVIQKCINDAIASKTNKIVELLPGTYTLYSHLVTTKATNVFRLVTKGKPSTSPPCEYTATSTCAELIASSDFNADGKNDGGLLSLTGRTIILDHIVVNGNKQARANSTAAAKCSQNTGASGYNMSLVGNAFQFTNSVSKNALCGSGLNLVGKNILIKTSAVVYNGTHNANNMWANGVTSYENNDGLRILSSTFIDNTGIQIMLGSAPKQKVQKNTIQNSSDPLAGAFAGIALYDWATATNSPTYTKTVVSSNTIDCSTSRNCGFGIILGSDPWQVNRPLHVTAATVNANTITDAQVGLLVDDATGNIVKNNTAKWTDASKTTAQTSCGQKTSGLYVVGSESLNNDFGTRKFTTLNFDGCVANWPL